MYKLLTEIPSMLSLSFQKAISFLNAKTSNTEWSIETQNVTERRMIFVSRYILLNSS